MESWIKQKDNISNWNITMGLPFLDYHQVVVVSSGICGMFRIRCPHHVHLPEWMVHHRYRVQELFSPL